MFCYNCGKELDDRAVVCPHCGVVVNDSFFRQQYQPQYRQQNSNRWLVTVAKVFLIIGIVGDALAMLIMLLLAMLSGIGIASTTSYGYADAAFGVAVLFVVFAIIAAWLVAGIIFAARALARTRTGKPSVTLSVLVLIFCNVIAGILLLCTTENDYV